MKWTLYFALFLGPIILNAEIKNLTVPGFDWHEPTAWSPMGVPTAGDSVIINGYVNILPGNNAYAEYILIGENGWLEIERDVPTNIPGRLFIRNSPGDAIVNKGKLENGGRIEICNAPNFGIINQGELINLDLAKIDIDSSNVSLHSDSIITNSGAITITSSEGSYALNLVGASNMINHGDVTIRHGKNGILNQGYLSNFGPIIIDSLEGIGINIGLNLGTIENSGEITITSFDSIGIKNQGSLMNNNIITVQDSCWHSIHNEGLFYNDASALLTISGLNNDASIGFFNNEDDTLINTGEIQIMNNTGTGILNEGFTHNMGTLEITKNAGVSFRNYGYFKNDSGSTLEIYDHDKQGAILILATTDTVENHGKIWIHDALTNGLGILNQGIFLNYDTVIVDGVYQLGFSMVSIGTVELINDATGYIKISNVTVSNGRSEGLSISSDADSIWNAGEIFISDASIGVKNCGIIYNQNLIHTSMTDIGIQNGIETVAPKLEITPSRKVKVDKSADHLDNIKCISLPGSHFYLGFSDEPLIIYPETIFEISGTLETFDMNPE